MFCQDSILDTKPTENFSKLLLFGRDISDIYTISSWNMIITYCPHDFWHKIKRVIFDPFNVFLAIATNIPLI